MRIPVRHQLSILLVLSSAIGLATLALATWFVNRGFVLRVARDGLETAASLKAKEIAISLDLMYTSCLYLSANGIVQQALKSYNNGSDTSLSNWNLASANMIAALSSLGSLQHTPGVQSQLFSRNTSGPAGHRSVLNITGAGDGDIVLPWLDENGIPAYLGHGDLGFPPQLYPNLTVAQGDSSVGTYVATYDTAQLGLGSNLILGPFTVNEHLSLMSMTIPVVDNYSVTNILGWLTIVQSTRLIDAVVDDYTGLGQTGLTVLLGPTRTTNMFPPGARLSTEDDVRFILPVRPSATSVCPSCTADTLAFSATSYPAVQSALADGFHGRQELGSMLSTHNEVGQKVAVAYATPPTKLVDWIVIVEQSTSEFWQPIDQLRTIILACLFSVLGFFFVASIPLAHFAVRPITRLRAATLATIDPLYASDNGSAETLEQAEAGQALQAYTPKTGAKAIFGLARWWRKDNAPTATGRQQRRYRIPSKVDTSKHWLKDDLLDLMETFNEMSDELFMQYSRLEERVQQRTIELEQSKKAAESANESKTLFVANVSHELRTPLNGILGMCATSIEDDNTDQMKTSLNIIYKSGDLLLRTLNDLLTFSTNQVGSRELMLEEREFTLQDLESQVMTIFEKQAEEKNLALHYQCEKMPSNKYGSPLGLALNEMTLYGDVHRLLQIVINLVSNSIKYTPNNGSITFAVRRSNDLAPRRLPRGLEQSSFHSRRTQRTQTSLPPIAEHGGTANFINPTEGVQLQEASLAPPGNDIYVEFEVRDTGQGIPQDIQSRIFEPFVQGEVGLNRRHSGTGLGLSICSQLAALMKGNIWLRSTVGVGSTFTVKIPLRQVMATPSRASMDLSVDGRRSLSRLSLSTEAEKSDEKYSEKSSNGEAELPYRQIEATQFEPKDSQVTSTVVEDILKEATTTDTVLTLAEEKVKLGQTMSMGVVKPIDASDEPQGQSTSVPITFKPVKKARKGSKEDDSAEQYDFSKLKVLVAEDNKVNQQVILRMLKMEQILQVTIAEDGQEALDLVKSQQAPESDSKSFDLVFMDIQMPNMDGITSARLIREVGCQTPIVALTAYAEKTNIDQCFEAGMNHFLAKPLKKPQLHDALIRFGRN